MLLLKILRRCSDEAAGNGVGMRDTDMHRIAHTHSWPAVSRLHNGSVSHHSTGFDSAKATLLISIPRVSASVESIYHCPFHSCCTDLCYTGIT